MPVSVPNSVFIANLRALKGMSFVKKQELFNAFADYFAARMEIYSLANEVTTMNYYELVCEVITLLRYEDLEKDWDENLRLLIHFLKGLSSMENQITDFFIRQDVVEKLTSRIFYECMESGLLKIMANISVPY